MGCGMYDIFIGKVSVGHELFSEIMESFGARYMGLAIVKHEIWQTMSL
jgi:hypothetical protein